MENILSKYIKNNREKLGLSLRELSNLCGVSHTEIWNIESGKKTNPSENIIKKICIGLKLNFDDLVIETGYNPNKNVVKHTEDNLQYIGKTRRYTELYTYNIIEEYLSIKFKEFNFTKDHQVNYGTSFDFIGFSEDNKVIGVEVKHLFNHRPSNRLIFNQIKSLFADFYFNFKFKFTDDDMKFLAIIIVPNRDSYDYLYKTINTSFNCLFPIFDYEIYIEEDIPNLIK